MPAYSSEAASAFERLHPLVQRWIWDQKWEELRDAQTRAIIAVTGGSDDVLITAATAAGKTEAAFLPVLTEVADKARESLAVLYVSPLKALINDQFRRLDGLCERMSIPVTRWHGDAAQSAKQRLLRDPAGMVLITPESIEALLLRRPREAARLFQDLQFIVIDELHAFLRGPRGLHLASLLRRVDRLIGRRPRRVGLSATIGDLGRAAAWLNPACPTSVVSIESLTGRPELKLQVRGYIEPAEADGPDEIEGETRLALDDVADHLFKVVRGHNNLVFGGSRRTVEALADRLRRRCETAGVPNEFFPHHGSLSKSLREDLELRLKGGKLPTTAVATSTLELGVDIGSVASVAQIGAPRSLSALRQRLGRSGRRKGAPAVLRIYVREPFLGPDADLLDRLRPATVRAAAAVRLLTGSYVETPEEDAALPTVVLHQSLALLLQQGAMRPDRLYVALCGDPPFSSLTPADFAELLRAMAASDPPLLEQAPDGALLLGPLGETLTSGRDFYALFETDQEWRLFADGRELGTIPLSNIVITGSLIAFAGRRWKVTAVDDAAKTLMVAPHPAARLPKFDRLSVEPVDDRLVGEMQAVYLDDDLPAYFNSEATALLIEGRAAFRDHDLAHRRLVPAGRDTHVLTWRGTHANDALAVALTAAGLECEAHDLGVTVSEASPQEIRSICAHGGNDLTADALSAFVETLRTAKYDNFIPDNLLRRGWARRVESTVQSLPVILAEIAASPT